MATKLFLRFVCILLLLDFSFSVSDFRSKRSDHDHDHYDEENFVAIGNYLLDEELSTQRDEGEFVIHGHQNVTFDQMQILVETIFDRVDCASRFENCSQCVTSFTNDVFAAFNVNHAYGFEEHAFLHATAAILYGTYELESVCEAGEGGTDLSEEAVEGALRSAGSDGANDTLSEDDLDAILDSISDSYSEATVSMCFNVESVFDGAVSDHEAGAVGEEMLSVCQTVVAGLLQGYCIGEATVPTKEAFVDAVFDDYATSGMILEHEFEEMLAALGIGGAHDHDHDHDHAHRRSVDMQFRSGGLSLVKRQSDPHDHDDHNHTHSETSFLTCYSAEELLDVYAVDHEAGITEAQFAELSSSLVQQILSGACAESASEPSTITNAQIWGYGTLAVAIISAISLLGGAFVPCMSSEFYEKAIQFMIALAVATLSGDAILHLIPQAVGLHVHAPGEAHAPSSEELAYVWRCLVVEMSIYIFFVFEQLTHLMGWFTNSNNNAVSDAGVNGVPPNTDETGFTENGYAGEKNGETPASLKLSESKKELTKCEYGTMETESEPRFEGLNTVAVMILLGDSLHNFGDGLAIGAAFTVSLGAGLSTSIAVLCHELPHELGDLAVLLKQGMKLCTALLLNLFSACTAFLGLWIGIPLTQASEAREWIFAVVAGMFLYVALVDMLPILHAYKGKSSKTTIALLQNIGFLLGVAIILVIAIYEDAISISI
ncbi:metal cation symporter ZIP14-like [Diadema antillarum]|uniref:metal cation symporter ZIP14-like n=1 Tax=Diadema antillarum TaxID=105358 RepID=UPI003A8A3101